MPTLPMDEVTDRKLQVMHFEPNQCALLLRPTGDATEPDLDSARLAIIHRFQSLPFGQVVFRPGMALPGNKILQVIELPRFPMVLQMKARGATVADLSAEIGKGIDEVVMWVNQMNSIIAPNRWADDFVITGRPPKDLPIPQDPPCIVGDYILEAVTPNWHAGALCGGSGCCGPAMPPSSAVNSPVHFLRSHILQVKQNVLQANGHTGGTKRGDDIRVAVIDTFPMAHGNLRLSKITKLANEFPDDPRLKQWLADPFLKESDIHDYVVPGYPTSASLHLDCNGKFEEAYDESDHGFFIADIINDIAPCAQISIYRVAGDEGCCTLESVGLAVADAVKEAEEADCDLIINVSLGFMPTVAMLLDDFAMARTHFDNSTQFGTACRNMHNMPRDNNDEKAARSSMVMLTIEEMFNLAGNERVLVMAAAGNDSCRNQQPSAASPRWPAIIDGIFGVASMDQNTNMSEFSNTDDFNVPPAAPDGFTAFGGSVVGLFTNHPYGTPWQTWAGTSFATPVAAGFAACLWSEGISKAAVRTCLLSFPSDKLPLFQSQPEATEVDGWDRTC